MIVLPLQWSAKAPTVKRVNPLIIIKVHLQLLSQLTDKKLASGGNGILTRNMASFSPFSIIRARLKNACYAR